MSKPRCQSCNSCGMPLENDADFALGDTSGFYCHYCTDKAGKLLPYETILENNTEYLKETQGITEQAAIKMAKDLLSEQPAWKNVGAG